MKQQTYLKNNETPRSKTVGSLYPERFINLKWRSQNLSAPPQRSPETYASLSLISIFDFLKKYNTKIDIFLIPNRQFPIYAHKFSNLPLIPVETILLYIGSGNSA